jgi:serine/threonine protein phosphatase PrpC
MEANRREPSLRAAGASDAGRARSTDEDAFFVGEEEGLFAVADGVGGSRGGEIASRLAVETAIARMREWAAGAARTGGAPADGLTRAFEEAHREIQREAQENPAYRGMATTMVFLLLRPPHGWIAHLGDSRAYLWRAGKLLLLTQDHSVLANLARDSPNLEISQLKQSPMAHVLTRCLGKNGDGSPEIHAVGVEAGDRYLLCCDGLTDMISDDDIAAIFARMASPEDTCAELIHSANAAGGKDNITAVVVDCLG